MTIKVSTLTALDLAVDNAVINLKKINNRVLSGICWFVSGSASNEKLALVLDFICRLIGRKLLGYKLYLFVGNSAWQPDTRVVRYRKLWGAMAARGIDISLLRDMQEIMFEKEGELKFFGAARVIESSVDIIVKVLLEERCSYLVALPDGVELKAIVSYGWSGDFADDIDFVSLISDVGGLLVKRWGAFDEKDQGFVGVGDAVLIRLLEK